MREIIVLQYRPYTEEVTRGGAKKIINRTVNLMLRRSISFELYAKEYQLCLGVGGRRSCARRLITFSVVSNSAMKCSIFVCLVVCLARLCDGLGKLIPWITKNTKSLFQILNKLFRSPFLVFIFLFLIKNGFNCAPGHRSCQRVRNRCS